MDAGCSAQKEKRMTRQEYLETLAKLYRLANLSDTDERPDWMSTDACTIHCRAIEEIAEDICPDYAEFSCMVDGSNWEA